MRLRIKVRQQSGERDSTFTTTYDGVRYTVGPEPAEFSEVVGKYLVGSFSDFVEIIPEAIEPPKPKVKRTKKKKRK